jgi:transitional endoplasmic reticulum ATPase
MDGMEAMHGDVTLIAATNRIDLVDPSVLRLGRFGMHIHIPLPDRNERMEIFNIASRGLEFETAADQMFDHLSQQTDGWAGADIHALCMQARMIALKRTGYLQMPPLTEADFAASLRRMATPSTKPNLASAV